MDEDMESSSSDGALWHVSVPGRTELAGNHQDHQGGKVIAASIDKRIDCDVSASDDHFVEVISPGHKTIKIDLDDPTLTEPQPEERDSSPALVRGLIAGLIAHGVEVRPCKLVTSSEIPSGFGLSSSAAFEICVAAALLAASGAPCDMLSPLELSQIAREAEVIFYGKPCGIMDQLSCAYGGVLLMDFHDRMRPSVEQIELPETWNDYAYLLVQCAGGHADASASYAQLAHDMQDVARALGKAELRDIDLSSFLTAFDRVKAELGDRAAVRGLAFFKELALVEERYEALNANDMSRFIHLSSRSGACSAEFLQNVSTGGKDDSALVALALCACVFDELGLEQKNIPCSVRIHGGGFGGTIQVLIDAEYAEVFTKRMNELMGFDAVLRVMLGSPGFLIEKV